MSIRDLKAALKAARPKRAVFVSDTLFWELYQALELCPQRQLWQVPTDEACKKVLDALLANQRLGRSDQIGEITWHLIRYDKIRVVRCFEMRDALADVGPASFEFI